MTVPTNTPKRARLNSAFDSTSEEEETTSTEKSVNSLSSDLDSKLGIIIEPMANKGPLLRDSPIAVTRELTKSEILSIVHKLLASSILSSNIEEYEYVGLCAAAQRILKKEPNVKRLTTPISVCGDIHGQFRDLLLLFKAGGSIPDKQYLFLGDYVDRGPNSIDTMALLMGLKILYPDHITLLRGNHECELSTKDYGFLKECESRFYRSSSRVWNATLRVFIYMPIAAIIDDKIFCVHGGLSDASPTIAHMEALDRSAVAIVEDSASEIMSDMLWSDPISTGTGFRKSYRGAGKVFSQDAFDKFMAENEMELMVRGHELAMDGFFKMFGDRLITVWSAPNYCGSNANKACILEVDTKHRLNFVFFGATDFVPPPRASYGW